MVASSLSDKDNIAWVEYRRAKKQGDTKRKVAEGPRSKKDKVKGDGQTLNGSNRRTGVRSRCYKCDSEYRLALKCPLRDKPRSESVPGSAETRRVHRPSYPTISMETPVNAQTPAHSVVDEGGAT